MIAPQLSLQETQSASGQAMLARVLSQYVDDLERGPAASPDDLIKMYPEIAEPLRERLEGVGWFQRAMQGIKAAGSRPLSSPPPMEHRLGDYLIMREIGRGGMGVVYEARQISLGRTVALKLLPLSGFLDQKQIARFRNEAQAAAALHHPNIVPVFGVGSQDGVHYYSMQFIDGQPLNRIIAQLRGELEPNAGHEGSRDHPIGSIREADNNLHMASTADGAGSPNFSTLEGATKLLKCETSLAPSARTRSYVRKVAELMVQAAEALEHAHECGVIHRDIKPSNLLVDRHGKLWITDFGLARSAIGPDLTVTGDLLGTIRYMSPEQAAGKTQLVDHRTDVYSLGITLFEALTLQPAYPGEDRQAILQQIQEEPFPSPRALNPAIPYDLETIVLKAVGKAREDRYASAQELANDLRRFLAGEPTQARRPTMFDRAVKWVGRHKGIAAGLVVVLTFALVGVSIAAAMLANKQKEADTALARARAHLRKLQQVVDRLGAGVSEELRDVGGAERVRGQLLRDTLACYQTLLNYASNDPQLAEDAARAAFKAGAVHEQLGENEHALQLYAASQDRFSKLITGGSNSPELVADLALVENNRGALWTRMGKLGLAVGTLRDAADKQYELMQQYPHNPRFQNEWSLTQINLGLALANSGRVSAAAECYRRAIERLRTTSDSHSFDSIQRQRLAMALHNRSGLLADDDLAQAEELAREAMEILRDVQGSDARAELGLVLSHLASMVSRQARHEEAVRIFEQAIAIQRDFVEQSPLRPAYRVDLASTYNNLGQRLLDGDDLVKAEENLLKARELFQQLVNEGADIPMHFEGLAAVWDNLGILRERAGKLNDAADAFESAVNMQAAACQLAPVMDFYPSLLARYRANRDRVLRALPQPRPRTESATWNKVSSTING